MLFGGILQLPDNYINYLLCIDEFYIIVRSAARTGRRRMSASNWHDGYKSILRLYKSWWNWWNKLGSTRWIRPVFHWYRVNSNEEDIDR